jgi:hypothetical protein
MSQKVLTGVLALCVALAALSTRAAAADAPALPRVSDVALQPLAAHAKALTEAMDFLGAPLPDATRAALEAAYGDADEARAIGAIQAALDPLCLAAVDINPESRVKAAAGPAKPALVESGWRTFLVKVHNVAGVTAPLRVASPQAQPLHNAPAAEVKDRWLDLSPFTGRPLAGERLTGLELEYRVVQLYSRDAGKRSAKLSFDVGQGTQDLGFRSDVEILFTAEPSNELTFRVLDEDGTPTMAALTIRDRQGHVYPSPAKRLAPDFAFHPQVYRADGESVKLPAGAYTVDVTRGPEYLPTRLEVVTTGAKSQTASVKLKRWVDPAKFGYVSGDHHIHAAGCAHYANPTQGVHAKDMMRHVLGEDLKVGCNLTWGPCFDYQKQFFTGQNDAVSASPYLLRYDVEVSGFGSHQSGHLVLLRLKDMMYPGGDSDEHWPTLGLNTLRWAKAQGAVTGPAHSGSGIRNVDGNLPSYVVPAYDGIGANEFVVDVTHEVPGPDGKPVPAIDFISTVDTAPLDELNMWYHVLNCGFRIRASGETDFPCITGERVGLGRSYVKLDDGQPLTYDAWCEGVRKGRSYVSEGHSHIMDMALNGVELGTNESALQLAVATEDAVLTAKVAAYLPEQRPADGGRSSIPWSIEQARIGDTRNVKLEVVVNGIGVAEKTIAADGTLHDVSFEGVRFDRSSWVALRIFPSSHTNPIFVIVDGKPVRASRRSAAWCLKGVDRCWQSKQQFYAPAEMGDAKAAYAHARQTYRQILDESAAD